MEKDLSVTQEQRDELSAAVEAELAKVGAAVAGTVPEVVLSSNGGTKRDVVLHTVKAMADIYRPLLQKLLTSYYFKALLDKEPIGEASERLKGMVELARTARS